MNKPVTKELIWEILKKIQEDMTYIRRKVDDKDVLIKSIRRLLHRP